MPPKDRAEGATMATNPHLGISRKMLRKEPSCGVKTKHWLAPSEVGLRRVWWCENCDHEKPVGTFTLGEVEKLAARR